MKENMHASADKGLRTGCAAATFSVASKIGGELREPIAEVETAITPGNGGGGGGGGEETA
jgi:hypothetical protein